MGPSAWCSWSPEAHQRGGPRRLHPRSSPVKPFQLHRASDLFAAGCATLFLHHLDLSSSATVQGLALMRTKTARAGIAGHRDA